MSPEGILRSLLHYRAPGGYVHSSGNGASPWAFHQREITMKWTFRFTREVRDLAVGLLVAVAGAAAAWALTNVMTESIAILAVALGVALVLTVAAVVLKAVQRPSEEPGKNEKSATPRRTNHRDQGSKVDRPRRSTPKEPLAP